MSASKPPPKRYAVLAIGLGLYALSLSLGWLPAEEGGAGNWLLALVGIAFVLAGLIMLLQPGDRRADALAGLLLMAFSLVGFSIAIGMDGNPGRRGAASMSLPQLFVGLGSLVTLLMSLWAVRRWLRSDDPSE